MQRNIENLNIVAFRGLRNLELNDLGGVNLFVGPNNSGKTSVLEAIATFSRPLDPQEWINAVRRREITSTWETIREGMFWMFPRDRFLTAENVYVIPSGKDRVKTIVGERRSPPAHFEGESCVSGQSRSIRRHASARCMEVTYEIFRVPRMNSNVPSDDADQTRKGFKLELESHIDGAEQQPNLEVFTFTEDSPTAISDAGTDSALPVHTISAVAHRVEREQISLLSQVLQNRRQESLVELMRGFDDEIRGFEFLSPDGRSPIAFVTRSAGGALPLTTFGDGLRRALSFGLGTLAAENGNLLIDEIESSIHVSALPKVFSWLAKACAIQHSALRHHPQPRRRRCPAHGLRGNRPQPIGRLSSRFHPRKIACQAYRWRSAASLAL